MASIVYQPSEGSWWLQHRHTRTGKVSQFGLATADPGTAEGTRRRIELAVFLQSREMLLAAIPPVTLWSSFGTPMTAIGMRRR